MIRIVIVDDDEFYCQRIKKICTDFFQTANDQYEVTVYPDCQQLIWDLEENIGYDIYLMDIEMPKMNGMKLAKLICEKYDEPYIIFITAYLEYSVEGYQYNVWRYIIKNQLQTRLPEALFDLYENLCKREVEQYTIIRSNSIERIALMDILYLNKEGKNTLIHTMREVFHERKPIQKFVEELNKPYILISDRSYAVNLRHVMKVDGHWLLMRNGERVPISIPKYQTVRKSIAEYWSRML